MSAIEFDDVVLNISGAERSAPFSLRVEQGTVHAAVGTPVAAASLLPTCLALRAPYAGTVRVLGSDPHRLGRRALADLRRRATGWLLPPALLSNATIATNLMLPLLYDRRLTGREREARVEELLVRCGIAQWSDVRPADVPASVRTRASLARALGPRPELLITDDFASRMDAREAGAMLSLCREHVDTVLVATSVEDRISSSVDNVTLLSAREGVLPA
jgi:ABC-type methionine transport system ATPase subunit